ncbi:hypothetical protein TeGR_g7672 [Tetraparma gracilis]|uniref:Uncharacterized protein n=1 Tax=Tetraparma gracilis TaxID=2962635 RepID=A0ABQ6MUV8_9STRA|nr:hypothetical protein TeGR_g7672 [Tetraparma gracilis]
MEPQPPSPPPPPLPPPVPPAVPPQTDFDYIPGAQPFALGPFEHLFAGPGCAYETLNPTQLVSEIERLREAGHRPAINSVPHVACVRAFLHLQAPPAPPISPPLFAVKQAMMAGVTTRGGLDALFAGFESWGGEMCEFPRQAEPEGFMEAMMATLSDDGYEPPLLIEWLGANMSDADREDVRANGF